jgi:hypothetical protein
MKSPRVIPCLILLVVVSLSVLISCDEDDGQEHYVPRFPVERQIADKDFVKNTYFYLDHPPDQQFPDRFFFPDERYVDVFRSVPISQPPNQPVTWGVAYVDSLGDGSGIGSGVLFEKRSFNLLTPTDDYRFVRDAETDRVIGIELLRPLMLEEVLAVAYVNARGDTIGDFAAQFSTNEDEPLVFELIWPSEPLPDGPFGYTWTYMMRNIYDFGLHNIECSTLEVEINEIAYRPNTSTPDSSSVPWIRIFGLDQTDVSGVGPPDGRVDLVPGVVDFERGLLKFPALTPFDPNPEDVEFWTAGEFAFTGRYENLLNPALYTQLPTDPEIVSKFTIHVKAWVPTGSYRNGDGAGSY